GLAVHGSLDHQRCRHFVAAQASHKRQALPGSQRYTPDHALAAWAAAVETSHRGVHPRFVNEDKAGRIEQALLPNPVPTRAGNIFALLLSGSQAFFEADAMSLQKTPQRAAAARYSPLMHCHDELFEGPVRLFSGQRQNLVRILLQRRLAAAARLRLASALPPPRLIPLDRRADTDFKTLRSLTPPCSPFNP